MLFDERTINILESIGVPNTYWKNKTIEYEYWFRSLLHKIDSCLKFKNLPKEWSNDFFMICLWSRGFVCVFDSNRKDIQKFGNRLVFQPCNISGYDFYYQPTYCQVNNPYYEKNMEIGKQCELLKLTPDFMGVFDIIDYYASKLAEISKGVDMGLLNAKIPMILTADNEAQSATLKKVYDKVQAGESLVVWKDISDDGEIIPRQNPFEFWNQNYKETYIVHDLLDDMQTILNSFYMEIGLPVSSEKKERLITAESDFAEKQSQSRISCWVETLNESFERIEIHFGIKLGVEYASKDNTNRDRTSID